MQPSPPSPCPPPDAEPAEGAVFRCCKSSPTAATDLLTHEETGRLPTADPCLRRALSVFRTEDDARHQLRLFRGWPGKYVARAVLSPEHGRWLATGKPSHTSWWPAAALDSAARAALFTTVSELRT